MFDIYIIYSVNMRNAMQVRLYEIGTREMHLHMVKVVFSSLLFALQDPHAPQLSVRVTVALVELFFFSPLTRRLCIVRWTIINRLPLSIFECLFLSVYFGFFFLFCLKEARSFPKTLSFKIRRI